MEGQINREHRIVNAALIARDVVPKVVVETRLNSVRSGR
jgi:hypothetical protein